MKSIPSFYWINHATTEMYSEAKPSTLKYVTLIWEVPYARLVIWVRYIGYGSTMRAVECQVVGQWIASRYTCSNSENGR